MARLFGIRLKDNQKELWSLLQELNSIVDGQRGHLKVARPLLRTEVVQLAVDIVVKKGHSADGLKVNTNILDVAFCRYLFINKPLRSGAFMGEFYDTSRFPRLCQVR